MADPEKKKGHYLGTEIEETWWRRYTADRFLARGLGEYWLDAANFYFHRYFIDSPIVIPLDSLLAVKTGKWHSGHWAAGADVVKVIWLKDGSRLSSGFVLVDDGETKAFIDELKKHLK
jgi:hypothetical protein